MRITTLKFFLLGFTIATAMSSCVPLAIAGAGVAVGYIARDEGVGVAEPAGSSNSSGYDQAPVY